MVQPVAGKIEKEYEIFEKGLKQAKKIKDILVDGSKKLKNRLEFVEFLEEYVPKQAVFIKSLPTDLLKESNIIDSIIRVLEARGKAIKLVDGIFCRRSDGIIDEWREERRIMKEESKESRATQEEIYMETIFPDIGKILDETIQKLSKEKINDLLQILPENQLFLVNQIIERLMNKKNKIIEIESQLRSPRQREKEMKETLERERKFKEYQRERKKISRGHVSRKEEEKEEPSPTIFCPTCGAEVPVQASFCPSCGTPII